MLSKAFCLQNNNYDPFIWRKLVPDRRVSQLLVLLNLVEPTFPTIPFKKWPTVYIRYKQLARLIGPSRVNAVKVRQSQHAFALFSAFLARIKGLTVFNYTVISREVVGKNVHATIPKGNMGYDQHTVPDTVAVELTSVAFL